MRSRLLLPTLVLTLGSMAHAAELTGKVVSERKGVVGATLAAVPYESPYARAIRESSGDPEPAPLATAATSGEGRFKLVTPPSAAPFVVRELRRSGREEARCGV